HPAHVAVFEVVQNGDVVGLEDRHVAVQVFALEGVGDDGLVLYAGQIVEATRAQSADGAFELPGGGVGSWKREVPADVVFEDGRRARLQVLLQAGQFAEAVV